jgi:hypothetical protein
VGANQRLTDIQNIIKEYNKRTKSLKLYSIIEMTFTYRSMKNIDCLPSHTRAG